MRIAIVNHVAVIAETLRRVVASTQEHLVAWTAHSGADAVRLCAADNPDLILMDVVTPQMNGTDTVRAIMQQTPCAILIVTAAPQDNSDQVFRALGAGALDVTATPLASGQPAEEEELLAKIRMIGKLIQPGPAGGARAPEKRKPRGMLQAHADVQTLVAIGASTGGPLALAALLAQVELPPHAAIVVVQHIDRQFADHFATWLAGQISLPVHLIEDGSRLQPGCVLIAKTNDHLQLDKQHRLRYSSHPQDYPYRPSVNVFFHCVARHWHKRAIGVLLTGMGRDGAEGLLAMRHAGLLTMAQDQSSSAVYGMPRAAAELGAADMILPLAEIAATLNGHLRAQENLAVKEPTQ